VSHTIIEVIHNDTNIMSAIFYGRIDVILVRRGLSVITR